ncbi:hypothetical protein A2U01_0005176 [Trifolium medium]|uniref:Uncharacterized protein n=1 Tax=Trifolium medium TaxID=97028 RepID=A0A392MDI6_9FABA|nr:hypothetical protein [Trifolium medium]
MSIVPSRANPSQTINAFASSSIDSLPPLPVASSAAYALLFVSLPSPLPPFITLYRVAYLVRVVSSALLPACRLAYYVRNSAFGSLFRCCISISSSALLHLPYKVEEPLKHHWVLKLNCTSAYGAGRGCGE